MRRCGRSLWYSITGKCQHKLKEEGEGFTIEFFNLEESGAMTDAVQCVDGISEVYIIIRMGLHAGVGGVDNGFSTTR